MPSVIRVLDEHTINKIAAGEVIENPASVVKELVENSIDAGSTEITIEIKGGGRQLIRITDNGGGMNQDDALLCFERHATSKISEIEDVHALSTMGFRGEAIPSIASISKLTLLTCPQGKEEGTIVIVDGGRIIKHSPAARSTGTTIEVKSLFFNVPVRKKFQKSPTYDTTEIQKIISIQALAHPNIKFQLISNHKTLLSTSTPQGETFQELLGNRISDVLGPEFFAGVRPLEHEHDEYKVVGFLGQPAFTRHNRTGQHLFINKRAVFSPLVSYAIREGYGPSLQTNRHPVFILHLTMPGSLVDVNVHPQKKEVRLRQSYAIKEMLISAVEKTLHHTGIQPPVSAYTFSDPPKFLFEPPPEPYPVEPVVTQPEPPRPMPSILPEKKQPSTHRVIATLPGFLVLSSNVASLQLVDQRAAHSRILYERLLSKETNTGGFEVQSLLVPYTLEMTPVDAAALRDNLEYLNKLGIAIQEFGKHSFIVQALPQIWINANVQQLITEMTHSLQKFGQPCPLGQGNDLSGRGLDPSHPNFEKTPPLRGGSPNASPRREDDEKEKRIAQAAGRAAVSQQTKLSVEEGQYLADQLFQCKSPMYCPFGKSTMIELTQEDIAKKFKP